MDATIEFERWRKRTKRSDWGLAWFIANELCKRFYSSHGIVPRVLAHSGLGYYGIALCQLQCNISPQSTAPFGRITMGGNVENWITGGPGDHGLKTEDMFTAGAMQSEIIQRAIEHMRFPALPNQSHMSCLHKRRGASYALCFEIATILALRHGVDRFQIWNDPAHVRRLIGDSSQNWLQAENSGAFLFVGKRRSVLLSGEGQLISEHTDNLWQRFMAGESVAELAGYVWATLNASCPPKGF